MINTKKAFTLVELIVVITILAILGTIAFISLQGYSADARNSKRTQDINSIAGTINIKTTEWSALAGFVTTVAANDLGTPSIAGTGVAATKYDAGTPNYTALGIKAVDFQDPNGPDYPVGITTLKEGQYEIAASVENGNGAKTAKINGTYRARVTTSTGTISNGTWAITKSLTLSSSDIGKFMKSDTIDINTTTPIVGKVISKISPDGSTIYFAADIGDTSTATEVNLSADETTGLIKSTTTISTPVTNDGADLPY